MKLGGTTDLRALPEMGSIEYLEIWLFRGLADLTPIAGLEHLRYLFLQALKGVERFPSPRELLGLLETSLPADQRGVEWWEERTGAR